MESIQPRIHVVRGQKVILDADLAWIYGASTKAFNQAVKRNLTRFPADFAFRLTSTEFSTMRSQIVTASKRNVRHLPYAFTEHGAIMAANVLNSEKAVLMSVYVIRAFISLRETLAATTALEKRLAEIEKGLLSHDSALRDLYQKIRPLLLPTPDPPRKSIGFQVKERRAAYRVRSKQPG
jgi:hypothetical protein